MLKRIINHRAGHRQCSVPRRYAMIFMVICGSWWRLVCTDVNCGVGCRGGLGGVVGAMDRSQTNSAHCAMTFTIILRNVGF